MTDRKIEKFEGFVIYQDDEGFYWVNGGYFATIEDAREDIHHHNAEEEQHYQLYGWQAHERWLANGHG